MGSIKTWITLVNGGGAREVCFKDRVRQRESSVEKQHAG